jgi:hypothetical protein
MPLSGLEMGRRVACRNSHMGGFALDNGCQQLQDSHFGVLAGLDCGLDHLVCPSAGT